MSSAPPPLASIALNRIYLNLMLTTFEYICVNGKQVLNYLCLFCSTAPRRNRHGMHILRTLKAHACDICRLLTYQTMGRWENLNFDLQQKPWRRRKQMSDLIVVPQPAHKT